MKKIAIILLFYHFFLTTGNSQWIQQNSGISENLYDVKFINKNTGWTLGDAGIVLKTTNGGINWLSIPNPTMNKPLTEIHPVDSNVIYFVGLHSTFIKTTNGGINWIEIRNGPYGSGMGFESVYFLNKDTGWACGNMRVLRTTNGGLTFDSAGIFWGSLHDMYFKDFNNGIICGDGVVFKTTNGGMNWFNTNVPVNGTFPMFLKLGVVDKQYIWVVGYNAAGIYKSTNFATTWSKVDSTMGAGGIFFINKDTGFVGGGLNKLFKTTDGGYNWRQENTGIGVVAFISSITFIGDSLGWYVGGVGKIFHTTTGGQVMQITNSNEQIAKDFKLYQNYPNPFNSETIITFNVIKLDNYKMEIFDILGKKAGILFSKYLKQGMYKVNFDASNLCSGIYFYKLYSSDTYQVKSFILLK